MPKDGVLPLAEPTGASSATLPFPLLDARVEDFRLGGRVVGQIVTLGARVQFFTTRRELAALDGLVFDGPDELERRVGSLAA